MKISATLRNQYNENDIQVSTENNVKKISIPGKPGGLGSSVNGGELLFLSLATCFCNDIYREAAKRHLTIELVEVTVSGEFGAEGEAAAYIEYETNIQAKDCSEEELKELIEYTDRVAEIHNTLRKGIEVNLKKAVTTTGAHP